MTESVEEISYKIVSLCNLIFGSIATILFLIFAIKGEKKIPLPSKGLRIFLLTCCLPQVFMISIFSISIALHYFLINDTNLFIFKVGRILITYAGQQLRFSLLTIILDRIISTVYLEKYSNITSNTKIWIVLFIFSHAITICFLILTSLWVFNKDILLYGLAIHSITLMHIITLITCKFLHSKNQKLYKMLVYNISLKQRYQILENVKVLQNIWPSLLIYSFCGFLGPLTTSLYFIISGNFTPAGTNHFFYNVSFILVIIRLLYIKFKSNRNALISDNKWILSPLGNNLPANITNDMYFKDLKHQWN